MSASKTATGLLNTQNNGNEPTQETSSHQQTNEQFENSGVWIRGNADTLWYGTCGNYRITEPMLYDDVKIELNSPSVATIMRLMIILMDAKEKYPKDTDIETDKKY